MTTLQHRVHRQPAFIVLLAVFYYQILVTYSTIPYSTRSGIVKINRHALCINSDSDILYKL